MVPDPEMTSPVIKKPPSGALPVILSALTGMLGLLGFDLSINIIIQ